MKKIPLILCACLGIAYQGYAQGGIRADGAVTIRTSGAVSIVTNGNVQVNTGATLNSAATSTIKLTGAAQNLNFGSGATLGNLQVAGTNTKTLQQSATIATNLDFSGGAKLAIGANNLTVNPTATVTNASQANGYVVANSTGNFLHSYTAAANKTFPIGDAANYTPLILDMTAATGTGTVGVNVVGGSRFASADAANHLNRYWNIAVAGLTGMQGNLSGVYATGELVGSNVKPAYHNGTSFVYGSTNISGSPTTTVTVNPFVANGVFTGTVSVPVATVVSSNPTSGGTDTRITITGTGFTAGSVVTVGGVAVRRLWYYSPTQIVVQIGDNTPLAVNNVVVDGATSPNTFTRVDCAVPTGASAATGTGANASITVNWTNPSAVNRVDVLYRLTGTTLPATEFTRVNTGQTAAGARTFSITGLNAGVQYDVFVQIRCDGTTWSNWVSAGTATSSAGLTCTRPAISSPANNSTLAALQANLTWSAVTNATNYQVFTTEVDAGLQPVAGTAQVVTASTNSATVNFPKPSTKYRVWVRANCGTAGFGEYSDNFYVTTGAVTACLPPSTFPAVTYAAGAGNLADATLSWSGASGTSGSPAYEVHLMLPDGTIHSRNTDATTMTWAGLNGNQNYQYRVRTFCANGNASAFSAWQSFTVPNTYGSCGTAITALNVSNAKSWGVKLDWLPNNGGTNNPESNGRSYWVQYWNNTNAGVIYTVQTDSSKIQLLVGTHQGLLTGETYTARVWYLCNGTLQAVSGTQNFQLVGSLSDKSVVAFPHKESELGLTIYPNPAKQVAVISYQSSMSSTQPIELVVVDALGREVYRETSQSQSLRTNLNVSRLAAGVYLIKVQDGEQTATKRLVVE